MTSDDAYFLMEALQSISLTGEDFERLSQDENDCVREAVAGNKHLDAQQVQWLFNRLEANNDESVLFGLAGRRFLTLEQQAALLRLAQSDEPLRILALSPDLYPQVRQALIAHSNPCVRLAVALRVDLDPSDIQTLIADENWEVRHRVILRHSLNAEQLERLISDTSATVSMTARSKLEQLQGKTS